mmetsp:Transcript_30866/g.70740  ORF Transcript_30866/g.70740 Transcript_30866/m.70740 type:complete len:207 (+) Transcript_30866:50-670(+)
MRTMKSRFLGTTRDTLSRGRTMSHKWISVAQLDSRKREYTTCDVEDCGALVSSLPRTLTTVLFIMVIIVRFIKPRALMLCSTKFKAEASLRTYLMSFSPSMLLRSSSLTPLFSCAQAAHALWRVHVLFPLPFWSMPPAQTPAARSLLSLAGASIPRRATSPPETLPAPSISSSSLSPGCCFPSPTETCPQASLSPQSYRPPSPWVG